jgi:hypothetical protein
MANSVGAGVYIVYIRRHCRLLSTGDTVYIVYTPLNRV